MPKVPTDTDLLDACNATEERLLDLSDSDLDKLADFMQGKLMRERVEAPQYLADEERMYGFLARLSAFNELRDLFLGVKSQKQAQRQ